MPPPTQARTTEAPLRIPLVATIESRDATGLKDARLVNCYAELDPKDKQYWIEKRFGLALGSQVTSGTPSGNGCYNWLGDVYSFFGTTIYKNSVSLSAGLDNTGQKPYKFIPIRGATPRLVFGNGTAAYYTDGTSVTAITDVNFPSGAGSFVLGWAYLDGTLYVMKPDGSILGSNIDDPTTWNALNKIIARIDSDNAIALARQLSYVVAFKQWTTEFFYDAGNAVGSPLSSLQGSFLPYGCSNAGSVAEIDGILIWVTSNRTVSPQIARMDNLQMSIISTPAVERLLDPKSLFAMRAFAIKHAGHRLYLLNVTTLELTLIYDLDQQLWYEWTDPSGKHWPVADQTFDSVGNHILQGEANGALYFTDTDFVYPNDVGALFPVDIYTSNFDAGIDRIKNLPVMRINADQTPGSTLQVRVNDSDFDLTRWSNFRTIDLSGDRPILTDCGSFYRRAWNFRHQVNTSFRIKSADLQLDKGTL